jgi:hypothetical protein
LKIEKVSLAESIDDEELGTSNLKTDLYERLRKLSVEAENLADSLEKR